jgi:NADH-quinone oxidoreductase subunit N
MELYGIQLEIMLVLAGVGGLLVSAFVPRLSPRLIAGSLAVFTGVLFLCSLEMSPVQGHLFGGLCVLDGQALFFKRVLLAGTAIALLLAMDSPSIRSQGAEFYSLMLFAAAGMLLLCSVNDFICLFVALEAVTLCFYVLTAFPVGESRAPGAVASSRDGQALEAGIKYLVMGAVSASLTVYGISYIYGATGHTGFDAVREVMWRGGGTAEAYRFGFLLVLLGIGFKLAMVPLQVWAPDVYQGAPTPASAFLASCSKVAGFVLLLRLLGCRLMPPGEGGTVLLGALAGITLLYGTLGALGQVDLKRLLGYSSIAHAGFILIGIAAGSAMGKQAVAYYLAQYVFTVLCAFLVVSAVVNATGRSGLSAITGLYRRSPLLALALFAAMMSLAGVPPLSGALAKFFILLSVVEQGEGLGYILAGLGALSAVISLVFYIGVLRSALAAPDAGEAPINVPLASRIGIWICLVAMLALVIWPRPLMGLLGL